MFSIEIGNRLIHIPQTWNELSLAQLCGATTVAFAPAKDLPREGRLWALAQLFLRVTDAERQQIAASCTVKRVRRDRARISKTLLTKDALIGQDAAADILGQLAEAATDFAYAKTQDEDDEDGDGLALRWELTRQPFPVIYPPMSFAERLLAPPGDGLEGLTLLEYVAALKHYTASEQAADAAEQNRHIGQLIATLWRPVDDKGKRRTIRIDDDETVTAEQDALAGYLATINPEALRTIWFWFSCSYRSLAGTFPALFRAPAAGVTYKSKRTSDYGPVGIIYELAADFTQVENVADRPLFDALSYASYQVDAALDAAE